MTTLRHRQRHTHATIVKQVKAILTAGGWMTGTGLFGGPLVTVIDYEPLEAGISPDPNTVAVSFGTQLADTNEELGAGLVSTGYACFVDIHPVNEAIGIAIADDIKDALTNAIIPLLDFTTTSGGAATEHSIEFEEVHVKPYPVSQGGLDKRAWRSVQMTVRAYWLGDS